MALSSSGSISLSQIQSEWGGSNPISLSEYYSGSLSGASNVLSDSETPSISSSSQSVYTPATKLIGAYTTYYYNSGWKNSNIGSSTSPSMGSASAAFDKVSGADATGNSGAIPASGTIDMDKFRGTAKGTTSTITCYGWYILRVVGIANSNQLNLYLAGHYGSTSTESAGNWTNVPFRYFTTTAEGTTQTGSLQLPATTWYGSDTNVTNGANQGQNNKTHTSYPNIGNVTVFQWTLPNNVNPYLNFSGTVTMTFQF